MISLYLKKREETKKRKREKGVGQESPQKNDWNRWYDIIEMDYYSRESGGTAAMFAQVDF